MRVWSCIHLLVVLHMAGTCGTCLHEEVHVHSAFQAAGPWFTFGTAPLLTVAMHLGGGAVVISVLLQGLFCSSCVAAAAVPSQGGLQLASVCNWGEGVKQCTLGSKRGLISAPAKAPADASNAVNPLDREPCAHSAA